MRVSVFAGRVLVESQAPLKVSGQRLPAREGGAYLYNLNGFYRSVYVRDSLLHSTRALLRDSRSY